MRLILSYALLSPYPILIDRQRTVTRVIDRDRVCIWIFFFFFFFFARAKQDKEERKSMSERH